MNLHNGYFPPYGHHRKQMTADYRVPLNNQQHHHASSLQSARSSIEANNDYTSFLSSISTMNRNNDGHRPYRRNDFANNHLFIAKRKLARVFLEQPSRSLQSTSDLVHLFDQQGPRRKNRNVNQCKRQESVIDNKLTPALEQDVHLSVVNLVMKSSLPSIQTRDPLSAMSRHRRSQVVNFLPKAPRSSIDGTNPTIRQHFQSTSLHTFTDNIELDELTDNDTISDTMNTTINPFDSSLLCVRSIIPSAGPQHANHHLLQHR